MLLLTLLSIFALINVINCDGDVVELDSSNFEKLTQINTGATTGDWFIKFYSPWWYVVYLFVDLLINLNYTSIIFSGHCKRLAPTWEEVATELKGQVNVAKIDVTQNRALGKQYGIKGFPTLLLFRRVKSI